MTVTTDILDSINAEALAFKQAKAQYEEAFLSFKAGVPPLAPEHFWPMADAFRQVVLRTMVYRTERIGVLAAEEFLRLAVIGSLPWSLSAAVHFCLSYRHYKFLAYAGGDECKFGFDRGDDGYGDLMDAVVLLGREFNERLHAGRFYDLVEFSGAVGDVCSASVSAGEFPFTYADDPVGNRMALESRLRTLILQGENYFAMSLEDEAANRVVIHAKQEGEGCNAND
jgi:hypothetical protein